MQQKNFALHTELKKLKVIKRNILKRVIASKKIQEKKYRPFINNNIIIK